VKHLSEHEKSKKIAEMLLSDEVPIKSIVPDMITLLNENQTDSILITSILQSLRLNLDKDGMNLN
jgi:hypothetical protein